MAVTPLAAPRTASDPTPMPAHKFSFGLGTVGNLGRDPFGDQTRPRLDPVAVVEHPGVLGAYGVSFHDDDLVPPGSSSVERDAIVRRLSLDGLAAGATPNGRSISSPIELFWESARREECGGRHL